MPAHLYLLMTPEALVASMLSPEEFGTYMATGTSKHSQGQAFFFDLKDNLDSDYFDLSKVDERCVPHPDGTPKRSVYLAIYRVLEHVPRDALRSLWLITRDGRHLELKQGDLPGQRQSSYYLYKELSPVHPLVAATLAPVDFASFITDQSRPISVPRMCFVDLDLAGMADDPSGDATGLPYHGISHLRDCLLQLQGQPDKKTKTVDRIAPVELSYRCVKTGFYVSDSTGITYYPFPAAEELDAKHHDWWRSANA